MKDKNDYNEDKLYNKEVPSTVTEVLVEKNSLENVQLRINNRENAELKVQIEPKQQIQIDISRSKFPINLPANSQNLSLKVESSDSQLEVKADNNNNDVIIGNVSVSQNSFVFIPRTNVIVEYVNLLGDAEISRTKSESDDENKVKLTAKKVNLQRGSESKISNILISEQLNLAPDSAIEIKEGVDFSTAEFSIYKSIAQPMSYTYIRFAQNVTQFPKLIQIKEMDANAVLDKSNEEKIIIIHQNKNIFSDEICKKWAEQVKDPNGYKGYCVTNDVFNEGHNSVYAHKDDSDENSDKLHDKKGLSGGAIAGIVIGCIAAVAIVAILLYFFVFKKMKRSNSSSLDENDNAVDI